VSPMCHRCVIGPDPEAAAGGITGTTRRRTPDMSGAWHRPQLMTRSLAKRIDKWAQTLS
jgi:hypothetical protein